MKLLGGNMDEVRKEKQAVIAQIKQLDEKLKVIDDDIALLEEQLRSVTEKRDKAYETLNKLRKARDEVNACFYQNRSLLNSARELAVKKDIEGLEALYNSEVEKFMLQWSSNKAFRDDYERRILTSLDNRQLSRDGRLRNPDEKLIVVEKPSVVKLETSPPKIATKQGKEAITVTSSEDTVSSKGTQAQELTKPAKAEAGRKNRSTEEIGRDDEYGQSQERPKPKEIDTAKLKEMKREEEIAKAKLAMDRKKKLAEKAAAKAAARAQKEAEKKLKQKEKNAKKKAGITEADTSAEQSETEEKAEEPEEENVKLDNPVSVTSKEQKANVKYRSRPKVQTHLPRAILKRKKSHSYMYWAVPAAILALVLAIVAGYYSFGRV
ncbi:proton pump-interactor 1-like [Asparagus officinalis]|uniref:proton pump-interactor 1-like n=1 Tax=Asparagus officinalis TaxID=4686 RepID=UPI00098E63E0|nr:proton pump-interactor 1-like [Asparagus officinalis]